MMMFLQSPSQNNEVKAGRPIASCNGQDRSGEFSSSAMVQCTKADFELGLGPRRRDGT
jgi:hypothetical protein